jgi:hypothetical protein
VYLSSSSCVTINISSLASFGGCPCVAHIVGAIGYFPISLNQSTTTMMASKPLDGGKLTMKSMDTLSHGP